MTVDRTATFRNSREGVFLLALNYFWIYDYVSAGSQFQRVAKMSRRDSGTWVLMASAF
jgi:hypothetical protein